MNPQETKITALNEPSVHIMGSRLHLVSVTHAVDHVDRWIDTPSGHCGRVVVTKFHVRIDFRRMCRLLKEPKKLWCRHFLDGPHSLFLISPGLIRNGYLD